MAHILQAEMKTSKRSHFKTGSWKLERRELEFDRPNRPLDLLEGAHWQLKWLNPCFKVV
jgi:hypothetical protein